MYSDISLSLAGRLIDVCKLLSLAGSRVEAETEEAALIKGMAFVQIYAAYEYTVKESVRATLLQLSKNAQATDQLIPEVSTLLWDSKWSSVQNSSRKNLWKSRLELANHLRTSSDCSGLDEAVFPNDGTHYRIDQIFTICSLFGLSFTLPNLGMTFRISELVENRNKIAHGEFRPETVGCRYTFSDIHEIIEDVAILCNHLLDELKLHCDSGKLIA